MAAALKLPSGRRFVPSILTVGLHTIVNSVRGGHRKAARDVREKQDLAGNGGAVSETAQCMEEIGNQLNSEAKSFTVVVGKRAGNWFGIIASADREEKTSGDTLVDVILDAKNLISDGLPVALSAAEHRGAFLFGEIRLKVEEETELNSDEMLILIDAIGVTSRLDLSRCNLRNVDLSCAYIERRWHADPDMAEANSPYWKSSDTGGVHLRNVCLQGTNLKGAQLQGADLDSADLSKALLDSADLQDARLWGANLEGAFLTRTNLRRANVMSARLVNASVLQSSFQDASLYGTDWRDARILESQFVGSHLESAHLEGVDLYSLETGALSRVSWSYAFLDRTRLRRDQLGSAIKEEIQARTGKRVARGMNQTSEVFHIPDEWRSREYRQASEAYLLLKNNFNSIGRYRDASWAYQKERQMERNSLGWAVRTRKPGTLKSLLGWATSWISCATTGYGERPERTFLVATAAIFAFAIAFYRLDNVTMTSALGVASGRPGFFDMLIYSASSFFTVDIGTMAPSDQLSRVLTVIESALGISLVALFIFSLGNRISRS